MCSRTLSSTLPTMQEFSSVTASAYDAESLAPMLNEKAAEGWSVVSIVTAGTSVIAYLTREGDAAATKTADVGASVPVVAAGAVAGAVAAADVAEPEREVTQVAPVAAAIDITQTLQAHEAASTAEEPAEAVDTATAASSVPAGWYADPSVRFELRYWDGNAWTEHVSRAGQQYTDPPVA